LERGNFFKKSTMKSKQMPISFSEEEKSDLLLLQQVLGVKTKAKALKQAMKMVLRIKSL